MAITVRGEPLSESMIMAEIETMRPDFAQFMGKQNQPVDERVLRKWAVENLIESQLLHAHIAATQPVPSEQRIQQELERNAEMYEADGDGRQAKARQNLQTRLFHKQMRKSIPAPTEAECRAYYDENPQVFILPEAISLEHICAIPARVEDVPSETLALLRIKSLIEQGKLDWSAAVKEFSITFERDEGYFALVSRGELPPKTDEQLFGLNVGEISDVIDFDNRTFHLFRVMEKHGARSLPFEHAHSKISEVVFEQKVADRFAKFCDELLASADVEWSGEDAALKDLDGSPQPLSGQGPAEDSAP